MLDALTTIKGQLEECQEKVTRQAKVVDANEMADALWHLEEAIGIVGMLMNKAHDADVERESERTYRFRSQKMMDWPEQNERSDV